MKKYDFRDVSIGLKKFRDFLLGRKHDVLHGRFAPGLAPRSIPAPVVPRGPDIGYANKYYYQRSAFNSIQPPVVAPVAEGPPILQDPTKKCEPGGIPPNAICFNCAPTPGPTWWFDGNAVYECSEDTSTVSPPKEDPLCPKQ